MQKYESHLTDNDAGDIKVLIKSKTQEFIFDTGLGYIVLPKLIKQLSILYKGESKEFSIDGFDSMFFYVFKKYGDQIVISKNRDKYSFNIFGFCQAFQNAFQIHINKLRKEGKKIGLSDEEEDFENFGNPFRLETLIAFDEFSKVIKNQNV